MDKAGVTYTTLSIEKADGTHMDYSLCFDFNFLCDIETEVGLNLNHALMRIDLCSANQLRALFWSMLKHGHPKITLTGCGDILSADMNAVRKAVSAELLVALHQDKDEGKSEDSQTAAPDTPPTPTPPTPTPISSAALA